MSTLIDRLIGNAIDHGTLKLTQANGRSATYGTPHPDYPDVEIRLADSKVIRDIALDTKLGVGEAYMDGRIIIERGDIMELIELVRRNRPWEAKGKFGRLAPHRRALKRMAFIKDSFNNPFKSKDNVAHHYDIGNDLYKLMLDEEHMQYSCGYWPHDDMTLGEAQEAKLAHIAAKLMLEPGNHVLDIGCGWGGMAIFLASRADVRVTGITLSEEQLALARERAEAAGVADKVTFELIDYRDLAARGDTFDRIVSVGMFEHVGVPQYETFFRDCARMMTGDGVMLLHTIGRFGRPVAAEAFTRKYIFPGGYIPALSQMMEPSQRVKLMATDVEVLRVHYAKTLREWYARCVEHREKIIAMFDERFYRMWMFYLAGAVSTFEWGGLCNFQVQYCRNRYTLPLTRAYIEEAERKLLAR
ncbi:SAM-dependent methyltransferase [Aurantiacibacter rhizosphaerae]|uniref:Methyltransferase domain-containing protein n=1 Tax=Aurantiacibacter rhizosphaerae TaxID=2691582 RepID=A0A844XD28_9SPHN|nr:cyclopropane-fatty-acyl-phospholipid synthase family protein [Aurantiacibacter rhizosphaerae]MWV28357.1 methyltransferase domain-containing protein [Aurantiacibacter rhizosphaerae]